MALEEIPLQLSPNDLPEDALRIIQESDDRIDELFHRAENKRIPQYLPSDPAIFYKALDDLTRRDLILGRVFCEWGSGFGVCCCLAASLGYESYGVELETRMVEESERLARDLGIDDVTILQTSYVPEGYESYSGVGGEYLIRENQMSSRNEHIVSELIYEGMDREIAAIDVFFVYPWPYEQEFMQELFDEIAVEGAILLSYHKSGEIYAHRKVDPED